MFQRNSFNFRFDLKTLQPVLTLLPSLTHRQTAKDEKFNLNLIVKDGVATQSNEIFYKAHQFKTHISKLKLMKHTGNRVLISSHIFEHNQMKLPDEWVGYKN